MIDLSKFGYVVYSNTSYDFWLFSCDNGRLGSFSIWILEFEKRAHYGKKKLFWGPIIMTMIDWESEQKLHWMTDDWALKQKKHNMSYHFFRATLTKIQHIKIYNLWIQRSFSSPYYGTSALSHRVPKIQLNAMTWQINITRVTKMLF